MNQNLITQTTLTGPVIDALRAALAERDPIQLTLTPHDAPYFFARVNPGLRLRDQVFGPDPYTPIQINWKRIPTRVPKAGPLRDEVKFLEGMGLAMLVPDSTDPDGSQIYAVSPQIATLYAEGSGVSGTDGQGVFIAVDTNDTLKARAFINLLIRYVLPGMYWRNYYVTDGLAPHIHLTEKLGREMLEIGEAWDRLSAQFPERG